MESVKIEKLLEAYFEGNTSVAEEKVLQNYFNNTEVAEHLQQYKHIFMGLKVAREERSNRKIILPESKSKKIKTWWYSAAAMLVVAVGIGSFYFSQPNYTQEEKEALAAFEKSRKTMMLLSENLNKGAQQLSFVGQFEETKDKIFEE
jgi:cytochrome c-type biogenesis protein CcmH/NrfG